MITEDHPHVVKEKATCEKAELRAYYAPLAKDKPDKIDCYFGGGFPWHVQLSQKNCPEGWDFEGEEKNGENGCTPGWRIPTCRKSTFTKSKVECCLNETANVNCEPQYCLSKQNEPPCRRALQDHCRANFQKDGVMSTECWEWATGGNGVTATGERAPPNWPEGVDEYCSQNNGALIATDANCNAWARDTRSYGLLDKAVKNYCNLSPLSQINAAKGETICNCFKKFLPQDDVVITALGNNVQPVCWWRPCTEQGYKTSDDVSRLKTCGNFCTTILQNVDLTTRQGDINVNQSCSDGAMKQFNQIMTAPPAKPQGGVGAQGGGGTPGGSSTTESSSFPWIPVVIGSLAALLIIGAIIAAIVISMRNKKKKEEAMRFQAQQQGQPFYSARTPVSP